jgi:transcriptional regulator with XRE-family HTH domain
VISSLIGQPHPIDIHVGARLRLRRTMLRMSLEKLAAALEITFQQVQKYERGTNRIAASRLYRLCRILGVRIGFFYEGLGLAHAGNPFLGAEPFEVDPLQRHETIEFVEAFYAIGDPGLRRRLFELARDIATGKPLGRPKIDAKAIAAIRTSLAAGVSIRKAAQLHGVGVSTVKRIKASAG